MKVYTSAILLAGLLILSEQSSVSAQPPNQFRNFGRISRTPSVSPFLRQGGLNALNYYNLVRPQIEARQGLQSLQTQLTNQQDLTQQVLGADPNVRATGFRPRFFNYSHYYSFRRSSSPRFGAGIGGGGGVGGGGGLNSGSGPTFGSPGNSGVRAGIVVGGNR